MGNVSDAARITDAEKRPRARLPRSRQLRESPADGEVAHTAVVHELEGDPLLIRGFNNMLPRAQPNFAHGRSVRDVFDRIRRRRATGASEADDAPKRERLGILRAENLLASRVFGLPPAETAAS